MEQGLQSLMPARSRMSQAYWHWWRKRSSDRCSTETPSGEGVGLLAQQKSQRVVGAVIEDDQVILVTRDTRNRGGPKVTVYEVRVERLE
jgi:hypothetical protein